MTLLGWGVLAVGALIVGAVCQWVRAIDALPFRWIVTAIAAFIGAFATSEWLFNSWTPDYEGFAIWPALIGGIVVGVAVDLVAQLLFRGETTRHAVVR